MQKSNLIKNICLATVLLSLFFVDGVQAAPPPGTTSVPYTVAYSARLTDASGHPITTSHTIRFSLWQSAGYMAGDINGSGAINTGAANYAGWQEVHTVTPDSSGLFTVRLGEITTLPNFSSLTDINMQVEVKVAAAADTTYEMLDPNGIQHDGNDRFPLNSSAYAINADTLDNHDAGTGPGDLPILDGSSQLPASVIPGATDSRTLIINNSDLPGNPTLQFGNTLDKILEYDIANNYFNFGDNVNVTGGLSTTNGISTTGGNVDFSLSSQTRLREDPDPSANAACTSLNELIVNTTLHRLEVCTVTGAAGAATWVSAGASDFESTYNSDADKKLTTSDGNFEIDRGTGTFSVSGTGSTSLDQSTLTSTSTGTTTINADSPTTDAIKLDATNAAGGITANWGTGGLDFSSATGAFSITGAGDSTISTDTGDLNLSTTTSGNVNLNSAGDVFFQDQNLSGPLKFNDSQTGLSATYSGAGDNGVLDSLNALTSTTPGQGSSLIGVDDTSLTNISGSNLQTILSSIDARIGANSAKNQILTFAPEYPDAVIFRDGSDNQGTLSSEYDNSNAENYYDWSSLQSALQDVELRFRFNIPADFTSIGDFTAKFRTGTATDTDNNLDFTLTDVTTSTTCGSSLDNVGTSWSTATISAATLSGACTFTPGDVIEVKVKFYSDNASGAFADAGVLHLDYNN